LAEANADFEEIEIDLQNKPEWYLKIFPVPDLALTFGLERFQQCTSEVI